MNSSIIRFVVFSFLSLLLFSCTSSKQSANTAASSSASSSLSTSPRAAREFRAAWIATVANINWPSKPGLSTEQQKQEAIALLDFLKEHNFNAAIFQVRPQADALYQSSLEPWSYYLTGVQGKAPDPFYDPLAFWVEAAHERGLELHVWLNPYRAHHIAGGPVSDSSMVKRMPDHVVKLKEGYWWFDPSKKGTQDHGVAVVMDIVKRYDIDGVHFDDYFYPYPEYNGKKISLIAPAMPNTRQVVENYREATGVGKASTILFIAFMMNIKSEKKHVKFGLSPFGTWRPGHPESVVGFDQYDQLYADAKLWLNKGWIDYFSPQLYWPINRIPLSFPVLLGWWSNENLMNRHLWPGISVSRDTSSKSTTETLSQIMISRGMLPKSSGVVHWSISSVTKNPNMAKALIEGPYQKQALVPASEWLDNKAPIAPTFNMKQEGDTLNVSWTHKDEKDVFHWVIYYQYGKNWSYSILNRSERKIVLKTLKGKDKLNAVAVTAVDRMGNESVRNEMNPNVVAIVPRSEWKANDPRPYKQQVPIRITVHHEGGKVLEASADGGQRLKNIQTWGMGTDRNWTDVPYHYLIAADGTVYEGRNVNTVGETNTEYDPTGHLLICFLGNYGQQKLNQELLDVLTRLIAHFCRKYNISPETIATHRDYSKQTTCPGENIYSYFQNGYIKTNVKKLLQSAD